MTDAASEPPRIARGTPEFRRAAAALGAGGFAIFALLYCPQPIMPAFVEEFSVTPAQSSLVLSLPMTLMAVTMIATASLSEVIGRRSIMIAALAGSAVATILLGFTTQWWQVVFLRGLMGIFLSGLPAVAMAYLSDEMDGDAIGPAMGLYIGGSGLGGMVGRFVVSAMTDWGSWRTGLVTMGLFSLTACILFWYALPRSRHFRPQEPNVRALLSGLARESRDAGLRLLVICAFVLMGAFVMIYNYLGFRLQLPPFGMSQTAIGLIFIVYLLGSFSSARMGALATRYGRRRVFPSGIGLMTIGLFLTMFDSVALIVAGMAAMTAGFFGAHAVAASWVGLRATPGGRAQAASLYLLCYYMGSAVVGWIGGYVWSAGGWPYVGGFAFGLIGIALVCTALLARVPPRQPD